MSKPVSLESKIKTWIREEVEQLEGRIHVLMGKLQEDMKEHVKKEIKKEWCAEPWEEEVKLEDNFHMISGSDEKPCTTPPPNSPV